MAVLGELLFFRRDNVDLDHVLRYQVEQLRGKVDTLPEQLFSTSNDEEIASLIAKQEAIKPLNVDFEGARPSVREVQVEVNDRFGFNRGPVRVPGLEATKSIPFKGDPALWHLRTNPWGMNPPRGDIRAGNLVIGISVPAQQAAEAARYIDETAAKLPEYLDRQVAQIEIHNGSLAANAMQWIQARRQRLGTASELLKKLQG